MLAVCYDFLVLMFAKIKCRLSKLPVISFIYLDCIVEYLFPMTVVSKDTQVQSFPDTDVWAELTD